MFVKSLRAGLVLAVLLGAVLAVRPATADESAAFEFKDHDRVVLLGATMLEREQEEGYLETLLTARFADRHLTFRNLAWSGDTVWGDSRAAFDTAKEGFERMVKQVHDAKPSVLVLSFGRNESFAGDEGIKAFVEGYARLLDAVADTGTRLIFLGPVKLENLGPPLPDPTVQNRNVARYADAVRALATERGGWFVDLNDALANAGPVAPLTFNTMHFTPYGYWVFAQSVLEGLGYEAPRFMAEGLAAFDLSPEVFFSAPLPADIAPAIVEVEKLHVLRYFPTEPGRYRLERDGAVLAEATNAQWEKGVALAGLPEIGQFEALRAVVKEKNRLFFNRWRPQNETYIFGFRKHEQGQYAAEIPQYDPLVEEQEKKIAELSTPALARYTMARVSEAELRDLHSQAELGNE